MMMKYTEITKLKKEEILKKLDEKSTELIRLRFDKASNQLKDLKSISKTKKDIARLNTFLTAIKSVEGDK
ncbi:MAG: 50S ribosomal protein L29 [Candidatus Margulisbacteria bacterium]|nr:50S ribosomal protein L29 [Candidatus Margulisiibacteriota bacterium]